ncbi:MAG: DUF2226 domain-containing protein [archaeon]|nr:DUF2226 domain-containing protein [archaeon]
MGLPAEDIVEQNIVVTNSQVVKQRIASFLPKGSGYIVLTIEGYDGMEEGIIVFKGGNLHAALYEYLKYGITVLGDLALTRFFNAIASKNGVIDVFKLSQDQVEIAFKITNERALITKTLKFGDIDRLIPKQYDESLAQNVLSKVVKKYEDKFDVLGKFNLTKLGE